MAYMVMIIMQYLSLVVPVAGDVKYGVGVGVTSYLAWLLSRQHRL